MYLIFENNFLERRKRHQQRQLAIVEKARPPERMLSRHASEDSRNRRAEQRPNLGKTGSESQIKQTSSLELEQPDDDYAYWKSNQSVRRLNSNANTMEPRVSRMTDHPQSLEIISKKEEKSNIPSHQQSLEVCIFPQ